MKTAILKMKNEKTPMQWKRPFEDRAEIRTMLPKTKECPEPPKMPGSILPETLEGA